jgi:hypothetical protein
MKHRKAIRILKDYLRGKSSAEEKARVDVWYEAADEEGHELTRDADQMAIVKEQLGPSRLARGDQGGVERE